MPGLVLLVLLVPVLAGLWGTLSAAFGHLPAAGIYGPSLAPLYALLDWPGLSAAVRLSVTTGIMATTISLTGVVLLIAGWSGTRSFAFILRLLSPLLSVPHAAAAFGLVFMLQPSGWILRLLSPWATAWHRPPDVLIVQDPWGLAMSAGLVVKEIPFLLLMSLAALGQVDTAGRMRVGLALGYGRIAAWLWGVFPAVYRQIRLPVYVVLAYSMSVVDVAVILGPNTPPPLAVQIVRWMSEPELTQRSLAAAAAVLQLGLVGGMLGLWRLGEISVSRLAARALYRGRRFTSDFPLRAIGLALGLLTIAAVIGGFLALGLWSAAARWPFPAALPDALSLRSWQTHGMSALATLALTLAIATVASLAALLLTLSGLEADARRHRASPRAPTAYSVWLLYLPLLVPQVCFLPGLQSLLLRIGVDRSVWAVIFAHLLFVMPYVRLSLQDSFHAWDQRQAAVAAALGASQNRIFFTLRLPMLLAPVLTAFAVGIAVSVGQYLPTLLVGGGRVQTLATEAVALASGGDRRAIGVYAVMQTAAALLPFALALVVPALAWRNRKDMQHG